MKREWPLFLMLFINSNVLLFIRYKKNMAKKAGDINLKILFIIAGKNKIPHLHFCIIFNIFHSTCFYIAIRELAAFLHKLIIYIF